MLHCQWQTQIAFTRTSHSSMLTTTIYFYCFNFNHDSREVGRNIVCTLQSNLPIYVFEWQTQWLCIAAKVEPGSTSVQDILALFCQSPLHGRTAFGSHYDQGYAYAGTFHTCVLQNMMATSCVDTGSMWTLAEMWMQKPWIGQAAHHKLLTKVTSLTGRQWLHILGPVVLNCTCCYPQ